MLGGHCIGVFRGIAGLANSSCAKETINDSSSPFPAIAERTERASLRGLLVLVCGKAAQSPTLGGVDFYLPTYPANRSARGRLGRSGTSLDPQTPPAWRPARPRLRGDPHSCQPATASRLALSGPCSWSAWPLARTLLLEAGACRPSDVHAQGAFKSLFT